MSAIFSFVTAFIAILLTVTASSAILFALIAFVAILLALTALSAILSPVIAFIAIFLLVTDKSDILDSFTAPSTNLEPDTQLSCSFCSLTLLLLRRSLVIAEGIIFAVVIAFSANCNVPIMSVDDEPEPLLPEINPLLFIILNTASERAL